MEVLEQLQNFSQLKADWKKSSDFLSIYFAENKEKINFTIDREYLTNVLVEFYHQRLDFKDLLFWAINVVDFSQNLTVPEAVLDVCLDLELPDNYQNIGKNEVEQYLKILWPLGDYRLE